MFGDTALRYLTISASQPSWMGRYVCVCFMVLASTCNYCCAQMFNAISHACTVCIMWEQPFIKLHSIRPYKAKARMQCFVFFYANALFVSLSLSLDLLCSRWSLSLHHYSWPDTFNRSEAGGPSWWCHVWLTLVRPWRYDSINCCLHVCVHSFCEGFTFKLLKETWGRVYLRILLKSVMILVLPFVSC